jgi:hypothetical protein
MQIDMVKMRADQELVHERREGYYDQATDRYALTKGQAAHETAVEQKWTEAYAELVVCFYSVWGYADFDGWAKTHIDKTA